MDFCSGIWAWKWWKMFKDISGGVVFPLIFIWKKPKTPECLAGIRYPLHDAIVRYGTASSAWICWLSAIGALFILLTICIPSLFWGKWRNAQQMSHTLQNEVSKFRRQKIHRFPMKKGSPMSKVDLFAFLLVGNHDERTIWHNIFVTFFPTIFRANTRMVFRKSGAPKIGFFIGSLCWFQGIFPPTFPGKCLEAAIFFQAQVLLFFFPKSTFFFPLHRIRFEANRDILHDEATRQSCKKSLMITMWWRLQARKKWVWSGGVVLSEGGLKLDLYPPWMPVTSRILTCWVKESEAKP